MILFVGNQEVGYWVEEPAKINNQEVEYVKENLDIEEQMNEILRMREKKVEFVIYDLEQYAINATLLADKILRIYQAGNAEPIFLVTSYLPSSEIIVQLQKRGFNKFIFEVLDNRKKDELEKCMNGYYNTVNPEQLLDIPVESQNVGTKRKIMVGVAGACCRMGVTTQAMQILKYLMSCGKKVCYVELNSTGFVQDLVEVYAVDSVDENKGKASYANIEMYNRQDIIPEILHMDYEFIIYDYGAFNSPDFNKISFLEKDIKIMVLGSNPGEIQSSTELIDNIFYQNVNYVFNFTSKADQEDLLAMMGEKADVTYFSEYCPDMFTYIPAAYFEKVFPQLKVIDVKKKKRMWWRK